MKSYYFKQGNDGYFYIIFDDTDDAWSYSEVNGGCISCFDGYENAVRLHDLIGF